MSSFARSDFALSRSGEGRVRKVEVREVRLLYVLDIVGRRLKGEVVISCTLHGSEELDPGCEG